MVFLKCARQEASLYGPGAIRSNEPPELLTSNQNAMENLWILPPMYAHNRTSLSGLVMIKSCMSDMGPEFPMILLWFTCCPCCSRGKIKAIDPKCEYCLSVVHWFCCTHIWNENLPHHSFVPMLAPMLPWLSTCTNAITMPQLPIPQVHLWSETASDSDPVITDYLEMFICWWLGLNRVNAALENTWEQMED